MRRFTLLWVFCFWSALLAPIGRAAEVMPPKPDQYFNDYAGVVSPGTAAILNQQLDQFEQATSNQLVVAIYPTMQTDSSLEDYTQRITDSWHVGQKGRDNGAVLFVFVKEHRLRIQTNYGLEATLPDALCKQILDEQIAPRLRQGDWNGAMTAAVTSMIAATKGEYKGTGTTVYQREHHATREADPRMWPILFVLFLFIWSAFRSRRHVVYGRGGRGGFWGGGGPWGGGGWGGGGWGGGGGGGFGGGGFGGGGGGGGGGFSGGGGMGGGGGASGSW